MEIQENQLQLKIHELEQALAEAKRQIGHLEFVSSWPDGSTSREKWLLHVWHFVPMSVISKACIQAKENTDPYYLPFMEPDGWVPKADFTCWICGTSSPHSHTDIEVKAAEKTLEVFREHVWRHLCQSKPTKEE